MYLFQWKMNAEFQQMNKELKSAETKQMSSLLILIKPNGLLFIPFLKSVFMTTNDPELFIDGVTLKGEAIIKFLGVFSNKNVM